MARTDDDATFSKRMRREREAEEPLDFTATEVKELAEAIKRIDRGMQLVLKSGLSRQALVVLLQASTRVGRKPIEKVLDGLKSLKMYLDTEKR